MDKSKDYLFSGLLIMMVLALVGFGVFALLTGKNLQPAEGIIAFLTSNAAILIGYRYGSSKGSKDKDDLIAQRQAQQAGQPQQQTGQPQGIAPTT